MFIYSSVPVICASVCCVLVSISACYVEMLRWYIPVSLLNAIKVSVNSTCIHQEPSYVFGYITVAIIMLELQYR